MNQQDLDTKLTTQDETGKRLLVIPAVVKGFWYKRRFILGWVLLLIFLGIPWLEINGNPLLLFNIPDRRFFIFGLNLWAHDAPLIFFVLGFVVFGLFLATALFGRVWCGWACPQTIFIERVFRQIEIWTEGTHLKRRALQKKPWNKEKFFRKTTKWALFLAAAWIISNSFLAYFVGKEKLLEMIATPPSQNPTSFAIMLFFFGGVLFDFVWFREQFCTLVCPYGRFQSVLMDSNSLLVAYDVDRGEPRGKQSKNRDENLGDCINCNKCVSVCPTGIDIRNGTQMECIACTACIDACDDVMEKLNKPKGLIKYTSERMLKGKKFAWIHFRSIAYSIVLVFLGFGLAFSLYSKENLKLTQLRHSGTPYEILQVDGNKVLQNIVRIRIHNQSKVNYKLEFELVNKNPSLQMINPIPAYPVAAHKSFEISLLLRTKDFNWAGKNVSIKAYDESSKYSRNIEVQILGPKGGQ